ncbi:MAG: DUF983 domain-containing protein [Planctomycetaceae bacterium]
MKLESAEMEVGNEERRFGTLIGRALALRCPRCGNGKLFAGWFRMHDACPHCTMKFERAPGYFLGAAYFNYGLTALVLVVAYVTLHFGAGMSNGMLTPPFVIFFVLFPLFFFRYARALWLNMDYYFDVEGFASDDEVRSRSVPPAKP